jgi:hypothetical protein
MLRTHVRPFFGRRSASTVVASDLRRLLSELAIDDAAPGTIHSVFNVTRLVLNPALRSGAIRANPCAGIRQPRRWPTSGATWRSVPPRSTPTEPCRSLGFSPRSSERISPLSAGPHAVAFTSPDGGPLGHQNFDRRFFKPAVARSGPPKSLHSMISVTRTPRS